MRNNVLNARSLLSRSAFVARISSRTNHVGFPRHAAAKYVVHSFVVVPIDAAKHATNLGSVRILINLASRHVVKRKAVVIQTQKHVTHRMLARRTGLVRQLSSILVSANGSSKRLNVCQPNIAKGSPRRL